VLRLPQETQCPRKPEASNSSRPCAYLSVNEWDELGACGARAYSGVLDVGSALQLAESPRCRARPHFFRCIHRRRKGAPSSARRANSQVAGTTTRRCPYPLRRRPASGPRARSRSNVLWPRSAGWTACLSPLCPDSDQIPPCSEMTRRATRRHRAPSTAKTLPVVSRAPSYCLTGNAFSSFRAVPKVSS
jgi:hypothetical protein